MWKTVKNAHVHLHAYNSGSDSDSEARQLLTRYITFYHTRRPPSLLDGQTPDAVCFNLLPAHLAA